VTRKPFRIATWNILGRLMAGTKEPAEEGAVKRLLAEHRIDVLCLQEVHFYDRAADGQLVDELGDVGLEHSVWLPLSKSHLDTSAQLGVGIAAKEPLARRKEFFLSNPGLRASVRGQEWVLHDKGMVGCTVEMPILPIRVYSLHLFPFHEFGVAEDDDQVHRMWEEFWQYADTSHRSRQPGPGG
jgi:exonuclease III